jgi:hypothetical protein
VSGELGDGKRSKKNKLLCVPVGTVHKLLATDDKDVAGSCRMQVSFVDDDNPLYAAQNLRAAMIAEGKVSLKTCFCKVLIPASHIVRLALRASPHVDVSVFRNAVNHWLLCELLNAIGNHTVA